MQCAGIRWKASPRSSRYRGDLKTGMTDLIDGMAAAPGQSTTVNDESGGHSGAPYDAVGAQNAKREAVLRAVASNHPVLQQLGMSQLKSLAPEQMSQKDYLGLADKFDPNSTVDAAKGGGVNALKPKKSVKEVGGVLYDENTMQVVQLKDSYDPNKIIKIAGDTYQVNPSTSKLEKMDNAPKVTVSNSMGGVVMPGQKAGMEEIFKKTGDRVVELGKAAQVATSNLQAISELKNLESQGIYSNVTTAPTTFFTNLAQAVGVPLDQKKVATLGNTESFNAIATDLWQGVVNKYGGNRGVTEKEAQELKKIVPQAANSPQARARMYQILESVSQRQIGQYKNANSSYNKALQTQNPADLPDLLEASSLPEPTKPDPVTPPASRLNQFRVIR
jgi:hypothetical protein